MRDFCNAWKGVFLSFFLTIIVRYVGRQKKKYFIYEYLGTYPKGSVVTIPYSREKYCNEGFFVPPIAFCLVPNVRWIHLLNLTNQRSRPRAFFYDRVRPPWDRLRVGEPKNFQALFFNGEMRKKLKTYSNTRTALSTYVPQPDSGTVGVK